MTERPILFSPPMVQAILDGRKLQTRRTKGLESKNEFPDVWNIEGNPQRKTCRFWDSSQEKDPNPLKIEYGFNHEAGGVVYAKCPYGKPGDILWVRERFTTIPYHGIVKNPQYVFPDQVTNPEQHKWKPSIHMPKDAARIWLEVTEVRVERLNDISEEDAVLEGIESWIEERMKSRPIHYKMYSDFDNPDDPSLYSSTAYYSFESLWRLINGPDSWKLNPWVWVVSFKVLSTTGKAGIERKEGLV